MPFQFRATYDAAPSLDEAAEFALDYFKSAPAIRITKDGQYHDYAAPALDRDGPRLTLEYPYLLKLMAQVRNTQQVNDQLGVFR